MTRKHGGYYSKPGNGICHQLHRERFTKPGCPLVGSDSHSTTAGGFGALGLGAGGLDVAAVMGGDPYRLEMPEVVEVQLTGELEPWASAKDVVLELLRRLSVKGGVGSVYEFTGPGVETLSVPERCTITNMTTELGATSGLFPSDERTQEHLARLGRERDYTPITPDEDAVYADTLTVDLSEIVPLVAKPSMPDYVVPASEVAGTPVDQVIVGSCTNGSYVELATTAAVLAGQEVAPETDMIVAPASKRAAELLARDGSITELYAAGVNLSEATCGACIGQGHVPAPDCVSLRAFNRNFLGRSGNENDAVYLVSPGVAAASAIVGEIVDPRDTDLNPQSIELLSDMTRSDVDLLGPDHQVEVRRGETIGHVPVGSPLTENPVGEVLLRAGDDITTDHIIPASAEVISLWSDPQACADYTLVRVDEEFPARAWASDGGWVVAGENYGQGSSRENASLELAVLGLDGVIAKNFARIHKANLFNFGLIPLTFVDTQDIDRLSEGDRLEIVENLASGIADGRSSFDVSVNEEWTFEVAVDATTREREVLAAGGLLSYIKGHQ